MSLEKRTALDLIQIDAATGVVQVRMRKLVVDGNAVILSEYHRANMLPGDTIEEHTKLVNESLEILGWPELAPLHFTEIAAHAAIAHTPQRIAAFKAAMAAENERLSKMHAAAEKP